MGTRDPAEAVEVLNLLLKVLWRRREPGQRPLERSPGQPLPRRRTRFDILSLIARLRAPPTPR